MTKEKLLSKIREIGIVPVVRMNVAEDVSPVVGALIECGIPIAEITLTTPNAFVEMDRLSKQHGENLIVGAGTVLDTDSAKRSFDSGAEFIVTPYLNVEVIEHCVKTGLPVCAGSLTPTEVYTAFSAGADLIKVFPASAMGGAKYLKALKGPFPQIELMPTGGVNLETAESYLKAGAYALGVGGDLAPASINSDDDLENVRETARQYLGIIQAFRTSS